MKILSFLMICCLLAGCSSKPKLKTSFATCEELIAYCDEQKTYDNLKVGWGEGSPGETWSERKGRGESAHLNDIPSGFAESKSDYTVEKSQFYTNLEMRIDVVWYNVTVGDHPVKITFSAFPGARYKSDQPNIFKAVDCSYRPHTAADIAALDAQAGAQPLPTPQPEEKKTPQQITDEILASNLRSLPHDQYKNYVYRYLLAFPLKLFVPVASGKSEGGQLFVSSDSSITMEVEGRDNLTNETVASQFEKTSTESPWRISEKEIQPKYFTFLGVGDDGSLVYEKHFLKDDNVWCKLRFTYPNSRKEAMAAVIKDVATQFPAEFATRSWPEVPH